jgi:hypothetical protein
MYTWHFDTFVYVTAVTFIALGLGWSMLTTVQQKLFLLVGVGGLYAYSGVGAAYSGAHPDHADYYAVFLIATTISFVLVAKLTERATRSLQNVLLEAIPPQCAKWPVLVYVLLSFLPLIYPDWRIERLWSPPAPDVRSAVMALSTAPTSLGALWGYATSLFFPFYLLGLYVHRSNYGLLISGATLPVYFNYCSNAYVGRGTIVMQAATFAFMIWLESPRYRKLLLVLAAAVLPLFCTFSIAYSGWRVGRDVQFEDVAGSTMDVLWGETSFPVFGRDVLDSSDRADISAYLTWIVTLPIPKFFTGPVPGTRVTHEISGIITGHEYGSLRGTTIILTGLVAESVYIFGNSYFWLHGCCIGILFAVLCQLTDTHRNFRLVGCFVAVQFGYALNRAGIGGVLPVVMNSLLSFYFLIIFYRWRWARTRRARFSFSRQ